MTVYVAGGDPLTPAWLTTVLQAAGVLPTGSVTAVAQTSTGAFNSRTNHLALVYSADAPPAAPARLVLKRNIETSWGVEGGHAEVAFYQRITRSPDHPPIIVPCYAAAADSTLGDSYLLLQDLSATHAPPVTRDQQIQIVNGVPAAWAMEAIVDALALLHAYWWQHPLITTGAWRVFYTALLARLPGYWERWLAPRFRPPTQLTLAHGDSYVANFLCPRSPTRAATYLLDWQSYSFDIGAQDLVNLCATFWTPEQRHTANREVEILRRYYGGSPRPVSLGIAGTIWFGITSTASSPGS